MRRVNSKIVFKTNDELKTWEHLVIMECEMKAPPKWISKNKSENFSEWLTKFNFGKWKIADIDNFMFGNPLFQNAKSRIEFGEEVFKGSKLDYSENIDLKRM